MLPLTSNRVSTPRPTKEWSLFYVLNGDNDLREAATLDLLELDRAGAPEDTHVVAQLYRGELEWNLRNSATKLKSLFQREAKPVVQPDWRGMKVFEVRQENDAAASREVALPDTFASSAPSSPESLKNFLSWGVRHYPAKNYAVVLSGHGNSEGLLSDSKGRVMSYENVANTIRSVENETGEDIDVLLLDACSTANPNSERQLANSVDYAVGSSTPTPGGGWSEEVTLNFLRENPDAIPSEFAESFLSDQHHRIEEPVIYHFAS